MTLRRTEDGPLDSSPTDRKAMQWVGGCDAMEWLFCIDLSAVDNIKYVCILRTLLSFVCVQELQLGGDVLPKSARYGGVIGPHPVHFENPSFEVIVAH